VFSVTSDTAVNLSLQSTPSRSARADQAAAADSFSALIDNNAADTGNDRPAAAAPDRPAPRADDTAAETRQPRDTTSSSSAASTTASQDTEPTATQPATSDGGVDADTASKPKSGSAKSGIVREAKNTALDIVAAPDAATSSGAAASPQPIPSTAATPAPVAIAIAVSVAATDVIVAPASPGNTSQPLAIAAAAIATSTSTVEASKPAATPAQAQTAPEKPTPAVSNPAATTEPTAATATVAATIGAVGANAASPAQAAATDTVTAAVAQPAAKPDASAQASPALAAAAITATPVAPVAPKVAPRTTTAARAAESAAPIMTGVQSNAAEPSSPSTDATDTSVAPQGPVADGKQKLDGVAVDASKANTANTDAPTTAATVTTHDHRATAAAQIHTNTSDAGQAANAIPQPHVQSATTPVTAAQLTVTAATSAAVPLNGLALQIAVTAQSGRSRFEIRLDPAELGRIDVRIDVDRHGQLTSHLTVEKPETLAMLRQDAPQLQRALDNAGFKTGDGGLQFSLRDQSSSDQNNGNEAGRNAQRLIISEDDSVPAAVAGRTYGRMPGSGSGVDIRV
jgi:flagellar hook-length control protein FliK